MLLFRSRSLGPKRVNTIVSGHANDVLTHLLANYVHGHTVVESLRYRLPCHYDRYRFHVWYSVQAAESDSVVQGA